MIEFAVKNGMLKKRTPLDPKKMHQFLNSCSCDKTTDACDAQCCCDKDCDEEEKKIWAMQKVCIEADDKVELDGKGSVGDR
jgi:hypothetical protein